VAPIAGERQQGLIFPERKKQKTVDDFDFPVPDGASPDEKNFSHPRT
jgi:hypothetical protein